MRASISLLVITVAACGLAPSPDFTGTRVGDGIAPWKDLGPVELCFGDRFLGAPDTPPGGYCEAITEPQTPCNVDGDCKSRESCVCGRCTVAYCSAASDCGDGRICSFSEHRCDQHCSITDECAAGEDCFNGTCRGRCHTSAECQGGEVCNSLNFCVVAACSDDNACLNGENCKIQRTPRQALEPDAIAVDAVADDPTSPRVVLYVELADEFQLVHRHIYRATSPDGRLFTVSPPTSILDDGLDNRAPSVVHTDAGWFLYYEYDAGAELRVARAADGIHFGAPTTALVGGTGGAALHAPSAVVLPDGTVAVYYQIGDGAAIGLATGPVGGKLTSRGPVLMPNSVVVPVSTAGAPFWTDVAAITSPHAAITDGADGPSLRLWFSAFGHESADSFQFGKIVPIPPNYSIGYAQASVTAPSSFTAWHYGPVFDRVDAFLDHRDDLTPAVVQLRSGGAPDRAFLLYYVDADRVTGAMGPPTPTETLEIGHLQVLGNGAYAATTGGS
jgi:hypothetical protein